MAIYFSKTTNAFYNTDVVAQSSIPADKVEVTEDTYKQLLADQAAGKIITADSTGNPVSVSQTCGACDCTVHEKVIASTTKLGHVKVDGTTILMEEDGTIKANEEAKIMLAEHEKKVASKTQLGHVKVDGTTIKADADGTLRGISQVSIATTTKAGLVKPDGTTIKVASDGTICVYATRSIFEIFYSLSSETPVGAMDLSLGTKISNCNTAFPQFWAECVSRASAKTIRTLTEAQWQAEVSANGSCGAFVVDTTAKTVRLPKITNILQAGEIGVFTEAGLPNITGAFSYYPEGTNVLKGALYRDSGIRSDNMDATNEWSANRYGTGFDASLSNAIYGKSDTVQPPTVGAKLYIQVYNSAIEASTAQASQFVSSVEACTAAANAAMKTDASNAASGVDIVVEYSTGNPWYRKYKSGWVEQGGKISTSVGSNVIALARTMANTDYTIVTQRSSTSSDKGVGGGLPFVKEQTTSSITINAATDAGPLYWRVEGLGA